MSSWLPSAVGSARNRVGTRRASTAVTGPSGGRTWWAHFEFTRINIAPTILSKQFEELMNVRGIGEASFLRLKALVMVTPPRTDRAATQ